MTKILAETLNEFKSERKSESINEAIQPGKTFRQLFLKAGHAFAKADRKEIINTMVAWAKKLSELGWPKEMALKKALGEQKFKSFLAALRIMQKQDPSFAAGAGGGVSSNKGGDIGKDDATRLQVVANAAGMSTDELKALITK